MVSSIRSLPSLWGGLRSWWVGEGLIQLGIANSNGGVLAGAKFAQPTASAMFSSTGKFAGKSVDEVANALGSGSLHPADVPIEYAVRDGNTLILNTRSAMALEKAGIPRSNWNAINVTSDAAAQAPVRPTSTEWADKRRHRFGQDEVVSGGRKRNVRH